MRALRIDETQARELDRAALADRLTWLRRRDRAADELFEKLAELRLRFHLQFGAGSSEGLFGSEDCVPIEPLVLHQIAEHVYDALSAPDLELPAHRWADLLVVPRRLAAGLERPLRDLGAALAALDPAPSEAAESSIHTERKSP